MRRGWLGAALAALLALGAGCRPTAAPAPEPAFFFVQMADPQFGFFSEGDDFSRETANFTRAIEAANRLHPAFVVVCGDLTNRTGDAAEIAEYRRIAAMLDPSIPLYEVPGNHDVGNTPTPASIAAWRRVFGPDHYTFRRNGVLGVVLNSSLIKDPSGDSADAAAQERWLAAVLDSARHEPGTRVLVFQHHPWFLERVDEPEQYFDLPVAKRRATLDAFRAAGVREVFAGHYHRNAIARDGDLEMVTTSAVGRPLGSDPSGFRVVIVTRDTLVHRYYSLDSIPARIELPR